MAEIRFNYGDKFTQTTDTNTGIGSTIPAAKLDIAGGTSAGSLRVSGIATLSSYQGFVNTKLSTTEDLIVEAGQSGSVSGEVVIGTGQTISVSTGATTGQGGIQSLKVYETFMPPVGGTADRPTDVKPGMVYYNKDFKTIEFWDGNFWKQVDNTTRRGRGLFGGGQPGPSKKIDSLELMTLGNGVNFGDLISAHANKGAYSNNIRGIFIGGSTTDNMDYVTIASDGNGIDFGNLTQSRGYSPGTSSSTRGLCLGGWAGSNPPSNIIDYVEIMTLGDALDFGDLFTGRYSGSQFSSPTRAFVFAGSSNNDGTKVGSIEMVTISSKGNATDFGDAAILSTYHQNGSSSSTRGIVAGGYNPTYLTDIQYITMSSSGNAQIFGDLTLARQRPGAASTQTRSVLYGGYTDGGSVVNTIDFITIATTGNAQDFGDSADGNNYTKAGCSDSHGGLGGF